MSLSDHIPAPGAAHLLPDAEQCHAQLARILASDSFDASPRNRRFLSYVVEEALAGRMDRIKAYSIAVEVFGRNASFDAQTDPIVRVEAGQLRRALERYYLGAGLSDPVKITIPKGSYAPKFDLRVPPVPGPPADGAKTAAVFQRHRIAVAAVLGLVLAIGAALWSLTGTGRATLQPDVPRLLVQPFDDLSQAGGSSAIAEGLTQEVIGQLAKFRDIVVLNGDPQGNPLVPLDGPASATLRYTLAGNVDVDDHTVRLQARLLSREDGSILWAHSYTTDRSVARLIEIQSEIADQVATALGQPYGAIFQADAVRKASLTPEDWSAYACTLFYYSYRIGMDPKVHPVIRRCLKDTVARFPTYATAWGLLSQVYIDEVRFRFAPDPSDGPDPVARALAAAQKAVALDPTNIRGLQAEMFALYFGGDMAAAVEVGRRALAINPNDTELKGEVGYRLALAGDWDAGCGLVASARESNPGPLGYFETALAICAYHRGDLAEASMWIRKLPLTTNPLYHVIAAAIFGESGDPAAAAAEIDWLRLNAPHLYANTRKEIALRVGRKDDVDRFMSSLEKAGLPAAD